MMPGEDQERFEDYLELERYIEELQGDRSVHLPLDLTPDQARMYRMATLLRSSVTENTEPRPDFVADLYARLQSDETPTSPALPAPSIKKQNVPQRRKVQPVSRRSLLTGGAVAAASLIAGTALGKAIQSPTQPSSPPVSYTQEPAWLLPETASTVWHYVTTLSALKDQAMLFSTGTITGYVILNDDENLQEQGRVVAFSAACTHMGCIVQWHNTDRRYHCPCHGGLFSEYGLPDPGSPLRYLTALPRLRTRIEDEKVYVEVPQDH